MIYTNLLRCDTAFCQHGLFRATRVIDDGCEIGPEPDLQLLQRVRDFGWLVTENKQFCPPCREKLLLEALAP